MSDFLASSARWIMGAGFALMILTVIAGEMVGHQEVRRFLFWVRGRSEVDGKPTRRWPLP